MPKKKLDVSPAKSKSPPLTDDDDDQNNDYTMDTYNPETYDELDYEDEDDDVEDSPSKLTILERLALLEKSQTPPKKSRDAAAAGTSKSQTESPEVTRKKPPSKKKWTKEKETFMCSLWEDEVHLYDTTHQDYRNQRLREKSMNRICAILDMDRKFSENMDKFLKLLRFQYALYKGSELRSK